jgi:acyl-coenzyme A thioesterase PaaI-like protein
MTAELKDAPPPATGAKRGGEAQHSSWIDKLRPTWGTEKLALPEWEDDHYDENTGHNPHKHHRQSSGWHGTDLCHSALSPVRVLEYWADFSASDAADGVGTTLTGPVHFTTLAESHKGLCHGGSMCCVLDDVIGWCGFLSEGRVRPWSGVTAQINTSLRKPIQVNTILLVQATIVKRKGRKIYIDATLVDPSVKDKDGNDTVHAKGDGLVILNRDEDGKDSGNT